MRAAILLASLAIASSGCSVAVLQGLGDRAVEQEAAVVGASHPDPGCGPAEIVVLVESHEAPYESKLVTLPVAENSGQVTDFKVVTEVSKWGFLDDESVVHHVLLEGKGDLARVDGFTRPPSTVKRILVAVAEPFAIAFDLAAWPVEIWAAIFFTKIWPKGAL